MFGRKKKNAPPAVKATKREDWATTAAAVGTASPGDDTVLTNHRGILATEEHRAGHWLSLQERSTLVEQNVSFFVPQVESSTENDSVTSFQAQMAMSLTSPKNAILGLFANYCLARGFHVVPDGGGARATKQKYGVVRCFMFKLGLNERQERVAIVTFSIDAEDDDDDDDSSKSEPGSIENVFAGGANTVQPYMQNASHTSHASSVYETRNVELALVQKRYGGGSGYFEGFVTGVAHSYAAEQCFAKQQAVVMKSHLPQ